MNHVDLLQIDPVAWEALPEEYRADGIMEFWRPTASYMWRCRPVFGHINRMGNRELYYDRANKCWYDSSTHLPARCLPRT